MNNRIKQILTHPNRLLAAVWARLGRRVPDSYYLRLRYFLIFGRWLRLKNPQTFNEKLNWLKLYDRNPLYVRLVDKAEVKSYVAKIIGAEHIIPTYGVWDRFEDIDFDLLPCQFVLKSTNGGGNNGVIICRDKTKLDKVEAKRKIELSMRTNWKIQREWVYYDVKPRIIAEKLLTEEATSKDLLDYKLFCFNGKLKCYKVDIGRNSDHRANYYDITGNLLPFGEKICPPNPEARIIYHPVHFSQMIEMAEKLATNIPFVRVDFYNQDGIIHFGEMTFFPDGGFGRFTNNGDKKLGLLLSLP